MARGILQQWREQLTIATPEDTQVRNILELSVMFQAYLFALIVEGLSLLARKMNLPTTRAAKDTRGWTSEEKGIKREVPVRLRVG